MASRRGTGLSGRRRILRRAFKVDGTIECEIDSLSPPQATAGAAEPERKGNMAAVVVLCHGQWSSKYGAWTVPDERGLSLTPLLLNLCTRGRGGQTLFSWRCPRAF